MDNQRLGAALLATVLCLTVFAGGYLTYYSDIHSYSASAVWSDGSVTYTVSASGDDVYDAVLLDNKGNSPVDRLAVFADESYDEFFNEVSSESGIGYMEQQYYADQLAIALGDRGFTGVSSVDSDGLHEYLTETLDDPGQCGLMVTSYALPSSVYTGSGDDLLLRWIEAGGTLYWTGSEIGAYYTDGGEIHRVSGNQELFFGKGCVNTGDEYIGTSAIGNGFAEALTLKCSGIMYGLNLDGVEGSLSIGYEHDGYATIGMVTRGAGSICVFGGSFDINQLEDAAQVIAAGLVPQTEIVQHISGEVVRTTVEGTLASDGGSMYIYIGGTYTKYGGLFSG